MYRNPKIPEEITETAGNETQSHYPLKDYYRRFTEHTSDTHWQFTQGFLPLTSYRKTVNILGASWWANWAQHPVGLSPHLPGSSCSGPRRFAAVFWTLQCWDKTTVFKKEKEHKAIKSRHDVVWRRATIQFYVNRHDIYGFCCKSLLGEM